MELGRSTQIEVIQLLNKAKFIPPNFRKYGVLYSGTILAGKTSNYT